MYFCTGTKLVSTFVKLFTQGLDMLEKFVRQFLVDDYSFQLLFGHVWNNRLEKKTLLYFSLEVDFLAPLSRSYCVLKLIFWLWIVFLQLRAIRRTVPEILRYHCIIL